MSVMTEAVGERTLHRTIDWKKTFWIASGVPPLVLFSIGGIAATVGTPSYIVWTLSILMGFAQSFTYAEIAGMFPNKSGGAPIYGAAAWIHYGKIFGPLSVWCYWLAWSPVLSIGTGIAAGYVLTGFFPADLADPDLAMDHRRSRLHQPGADAAHQFHLLPGRGPAAALLRHPASRHPAHRLVPDGGRRGGHRAAADRRHLADHHRPCADLQPDAAGAAGRCQRRRLSLQRPLGQGGLDALPRRHVHRRLVDLRLRDRGLLHQRADQSGDRYLQGHLLLRHPLPACSSSWCPSPSRARWA